MDTAVTLPIAPVALMVVRQALQAQSNNSGVLLTAGVNASGRQFAFSNSASYYYSKLPSMAFCMG
jgi:PhoPQ-activated pathogenicity-related protein